jgi:hypothetical protein
MKRAVPKSRREENIKMDLRMRFCGLDPFGSKYGPVTGCCESSVSVKERKVFG